MARTADLYYGGTMGTLRGKVKKSGRKAKRTKDERRKSITAVVAAKGANTRRAARNST